MMDTDLFTFYSDKVVDNKGKTSFIRHLHDYNIINLICDILYISFGKISDCLIRNDQISMASMVSACFASEAGLTKCLRLSPNLG